MGASLPSGIGEDSDRPFPCGTILSGEYDLFMLFGWAVARVWLRLDRGAGGPGRLSVASWHRTQIAIITLCG